MDNKREKLEQIAKAMVGKKVNISDATGFEQVAGQTVTIAIPTKMGIRLYFNGSMPQDINPDSIHLKLNTGQKLKYS